MQKKKTKKKVEIVYNYPHENKTSRFFEEFEVQVEKRLLLLSTRGAKQTITE